MNSKSLKSTPIILFYIVSTTILLFTSSNEAVCSNKAVYDNCRNTGDFKLASCPPSDYTCLCDALQQIQLCFQQCRDDLDIQNEGKTYEPVVRQFCELIASASSTTASSPQPPPVTPTVNQSLATTSFAPSSSGSSVPTTTTTTKTTNNKDNMI
nr:7942_t:CDS:2 [Entrophospora candida]